VKKVLIDGGELVPQNEIEGSQDVGISRQGTARRRTGRLVYAALLRGFAASASSSMSSMVSRHWPQFLSTPQQE